MCAELVVQADLEVRTCERLWHAGLEAEFSAWEVSTAVVDEEDFPAPSTSVSDGPSVEESDEESGSAFNSEEGSEDLVTSDVAGLATEVAALHSEAEHELDAVVEERGFDWRCGETSCPTAPK